MKLNYTNPAPITSPQLKYIEGLMIDLGIWDNRHFYIKEYTPKRDLDALTVSEAARFIDTLKKWKNDSI